MFTASCAGSGLNLTIAWRILGAGLRLVNPVQSTKLLHQRALKTATLARVYMTWNPKLVKPLCNQYLCHCSCTLITSGDFLCVFINNISRDQDILNTMTCGIE